MSVKENETQENGLLII